MLLSTIALAFASLLRNKMRSLLTMLGIVIGVAAVIMMQSMGQGATAYVGEAISGLGSNILVVIPGTPNRMGQMSLGVPLFRQGDLEAIRRQAHDVTKISAAGTRILRVVVGSNNRLVQVSGVMPEYFEIRGWAAAEGRVVIPEDERQAAPVCILGRTIVDTLFDGRSPLGNELRLRGTACRVVGVMEAKGASAFGVDQDDVILMPYAAFARRIVGNDRIGVIIAAAASTDRIDDAKEQVQLLMRARRHVPAGEPDDFAVRDPREIQALFETVTGMLTTLLAGVAAVSLVVGGIGIMNIMLVSVTERTREIGVRLAIGARSSDILRQFLVEAMTLSAVGGVLGILAGVGGARLVAAVIHVPFVVSGAAIPIAFAVSVLVGVVFGVFPARKAARLNPLAALRFE